MVDTRELLELERGFWTEGGDYYRRHVDDQCLLAFDEMAGLHSNEEIAGMNPGAGNWKNVALDEKGVVELSEESAVLTYEVSALRKDGQPYKALVSTGYVQRDGEWKMAFHQQTPLGAQPS
ncbi:MAG: hypothetical protein AB7T59_08275 [Hyphomonadaceae bacterium]